MLSLAIYILLDVRRWPHVWFIFIRALFSVFNNYCNIYYRNKSVTGDILVQSWDFCDKILGSLKMESGDAVHVCPSTSLTMQHQNAHCSKYSHITHNVFRDEERFCPTECWGEALCPMSRIAHSKSRKCTSTAVGVFVSFLRFWTSWRYSLIVDYLQLLLLKKISNFKNRINNGNWFSRMNSQPVVTCMTYNNNNRGIIINIIINNMDMLQANKLESMENAKTKYTQTAQQYTGDVTG